MFYNDLEFLYSSIYLFINYTIIHARAYKQQNLVNKLCLMVSFSK